MRPSTVAFCVPVTSPAREPEKFVEEVVMLVKPAPLPVITPLVTVSGTLTIMALPFAVKELDTAIVLRAVSDAMSELVPLAAAPRPVRAPAGLEAPVPPLATGSVPVTSVGSATAPGVQLLPLKRRCWLAAGGAADTLTP